MILTDQTDTELGKVCEILRQRLHEVEQKVNCDVTYWEEHQIAIDAGEEFETPQPLPATAYVRDAEQLMLRNVIQYIIHTAGSFGEPKAT